jgi:prepilin-type N-terminal cleavage/methylation domain-containing protein
MQNAECRMKKAEGRMRSPVSRIARHASRFTFHVSRFAPRLSPAFTLLELLTVIAIMGLVAAIALPSIRGLKPNAKVAATRQLLDAVSRARQLAISQRTTVYMVFVSTNFWTDSATSTWTVNDWYHATNLFDKQLVGYAYVSLRSVGDQPGMHYPTYLSSWKTLPAGAYIPPAKFWPTLPLLTLPNAALSAGSVVTNLGNSLVIPQFSQTNGIPFPAETNQPGPYVSLPYIAFDGTGQLVSGLTGQPELIPIAEGSVSAARDPNSRVALAMPALVNEVPPGNTIENYSLVYIDRLTGRAHVERRKVQ